MIKSNRLSVQKVFLYKIFYNKNLYWFNWYKKPLFQIADLWANNPLTKIQSFKVKGYFSLWDLINLKFLELTKNLIDTHEEVENYQTKPYPVLMLPRNTKNLPFILRKNLLRNNLMRVLITAILSFSFIYNTFFYKPFYFWWSRYVVKIWSGINIYQFHLKFKFKANKIVPTFGTRFDLYFSASEGMFNSRLDRPKRFKKNKAIKFIMAKYLRKLLLISNITWMTLIIRNNPMFLTEILQLLNEPSVHKYLNPFSKKIINEFSKKSLKRPHFFKFHYFHYIFSKFYGINRHPRPRGKVKRNIRRKLVRLVNKVD